MRQDRLHSGAFSTARGRRPPPSDTSTDVVWLPAGRVAVISGFQMIKPPAPANSL